MDAQTIRSRAWTKLGEGNWGKAMLAFLLMWLAEMAVGQLLNGIGVPTGNVKVTTLGASFADACAKNGVEMPDLGLPQALLDIKLYIATTRWKLTAYLVTLFTNGALTAGFALFGVAVMRNGARVMQVLSGFGRILSCGWLNLLMVLRIALWSLLLLIPGMVAFYAYRMAFFLKADHPDWSAARLLAESSRMMKGHKWRLMCLDASFIGWILLCCFTLGLACIFVIPYMGVADAAFYEDLLDRETPPAVPAPDPAATSL